MITDYQVAAILLAAEERELEAFEVWRAHWEKNLPEMSGQEHYGDCVKVPMTCSRCLHDEIMPIAALARKAVEPALAAKDAEIERLREALRSLEREIRTEQAGVMGANPQYAGGLLRAAEIVERAAQKALPE